jgi:hypothetical protein
MVPQLYCTKIIFIWNFLKFQMIREKNSLNVRSEIIQHSQLIQDPLLYTINIYVLNITIFLEGLFTFQTFRWHIIKTLDINKLMLSTLKNLKISINLLTYYSTYFKYPNFITFNF